MYVCQSLAAQLSSALCNPMDRSPPRPSVHSIFSGKNTGMGYHFLLQGSSQSRDLAIPVSPAFKVDSLPILDHKQRKGETIIRCFTFSVFKFIARAYFFSHLPCILLTRFCFVLWYRFFMPPKFMLYRCLDS